jgi:hypothetical protein
MGIHSYEPFEISQLNECLMINSMLTHGGVSSGMAEGTGSAVVSALQTKWKNHG